MRDKQAASTAAVSTAPVRRLTIAAEPAFTYAPDGLRHGGDEDDLGFFPAEDEDEPSFADAYAVRRGRGRGAEADEQYAGYGYAATYDDYDEADDEAEAAYVDELGLALPA